MKTPEQSFVTKVCNADPNHPVMVAENSEYHKLAYSLFEKGQVSLKQANIPGVLVVTKPK